MSDLTARLRLEATGGSAAADEIQKPARALGEVADSSDRAAAGARRAADAFERAGDSAQAARRDFASMFDEAQLDFVSLYNKQMGLAAAANDNVGRTARLTGHQVTNLGRQFADVGVMAAMGMSPFMVLVSQGPQIVDVLAEAKRGGVGFGQAMAQIGGMIRPFVPALLGIGAAAGVAFGGAALAARALNNENGDLTKGLGLTEKQLERLKEEGVETGVTIGDVFRGTYNFIAQGVGEVLAPVGRWFSELFDNITAYAVSATRNIVGAFGGTFEAVRATWRMFPAVFSDLVVSGVNLAIAAIEKLMNTVSDGINRLIAKGNELSRRFGGPQLGFLGGVALGRAANSNEGAASGAWNAARDAYGRGFGEGQAAVGDFFSAWSASVLGANRDRILDAAGDPGRSRRARALRDAFDQRYAGIQAELERAKAEELQAQLALTKDVAERARIEKQIIEAQVATKQAQADQKIAQIQADRNLTDGQKRELSAQWELVKQKNRIVGDLQLRAVDERANTEAARQARALSEAQLDAQIALLGSQAEASKSAFQRSKIEIEILRQQQGLEKARLESVTEANGYSRKEVEIAKARLAVLDEIHANELAQAEAGSQLFDALQEATNAVSSFKSAFRRHDWRGVFDSLVQTIQTIRASFDSYGLGGGLMTLGSAAASAIGGRTGRAIGGGLGIAGLGMGLGSTLGSLGSALSLGGSLSSLGTLGMGGMLSSIAPMLGPIGIAAGAAYAIAKLFNIGGKKSNEGAGFDLITGQMSGNKRTAETEEAARSAGEAILRAQEALEAAGIDLTDSVRGLVIGTRDQTQIYLSSGRELRSAVGDAGAAVDTAMRALLESANYGSEAQKKLVQDMTAAGKGLDQILAGLESYAQAQKIPQQIADAILQLTDPKAWAVEELKRAQEDQRDALKAARDAGYLTVEQYDQALTQLAQLEQLQLADVLSRFADAVDNATGSLAGRSADLRRSVEDEILGRTDPRALALRELDREIAALQEEAAALIAGGALTADFLQQIDELRALRLDEIMKRFADATVDAAERLKVAAGFEQSIADRILELTNPDAYRLKSINDAYAGKAAEAQKLIAEGLLDAGILDQLEELRILEIKAAFQELGGAVEETVDVFAQARPRLLSWLDQMRLGPSAELSPAAQRAEALRQYEDILARARGGDAEALANITTYGERLLSADRLATSSAQERQALYARVMSEIGGLAGMAQSPAAQQALMAKAAEATLNAELLAQAEGGRRVLIANVPALKDMYVEAGAAHTERLVAANDRTREEVVAQLKLLLRENQAQVEALKASDRGQAAMIAGLEAVVRRLEQQLAAAQQLAEETRLQNTYLRARSARA